MALDLPRTLSPSKASAFTDCPLAFRYSIIDHLPEPPSPHAVKGTLVHAALERLFWDRLPGERTPEAAIEALGEALDAIQEDAEFVGLNLDIDEASEFRADAEVLVHNYFRIEDPNAVRAIGVELGLETEMGSMVLRGIIDRLDLAEDGGLVVVDYKTGRAPGAQFE
ncbi:MAG TPA: PD-(D/E)XK nuclease family protein, partial [Acidimicrobiales bacterium]|nr:PD-(D/E)XK nuclease family protein [Acidimicrobiales bacterium]